MKIKVIYISFPDDIHGIIKGMVQEQSKANYLIAIDDRNTEGEQSFALRHELSHIALKHFDDSFPLEAAERQADSLAEKMTVDELMRLCE